MCFVCTFCTSTSSGLCFKLFLFLWKFFFFYYFSLNAPFILFLTVNFFNFFFFLFSLRLVMNRDFHFIHARLIYIDNWIHFVNAQLYYLHFHKLTERPYGGWVSVIHYNASYGSSKCENKRVKWNHKGRWISMAHILFWKSHSIKF